MTGASWKVDWFVSRLCWQGYESGLSEAELTVVDSWLPFSTAEQVTLETIEFKNVAMNMPFEFPTSESSISVVTRVEETALVSLCDSRDCIRLTQVEHRYNLCEDLAGSLEEQGAVVEVVLTPYLPRLEHPSGCQEVPPSRLFLVVMV